MLQATLLHSMAAAGEALLSRRSWSSDLPVELLFGIFQKLTDCDDISQCAAVCLSWRSVIRNFYRQLKSLQSPFLLLESSSASYLARSRWCSCTLFNPQTHERQEIFLPQLKQSTSTWSSYDGWLLVLPFSMLKNLCLLNPFTRDRTKLPPHLIEFDSDNCPDMIRVLASTSPLDPECLFFFFLKTETCSSAGQETNHGPRWSSTIPVTNIIAVMVIRFALRVNSMLNTSVEYII